MSVLLQCIPSIVMSIVERHLRKGVSMRFSPNCLRRFIWKHVELTKRHSNRLRSPPISSGLSSPEGSLNSELGAVMDTAAAGGG